MRTRAIIRDKQGLSEIRKDKMETSTEIAELKSAMKILKRRNDMENKANVENNLKSFPKMQCKGQELKTMQEILHIECSDENLIKGLSYGHTNKIRTIL